MNEEIKNNRQFIRMEDIFYILIKRWKMILLITLATTLMVTSVSFFLISPKYTANTKVFIGKENTKDQTYNSNDVQMYQKLLKTYAEIILTNDLVNKAIMTDNLNITSEEVLKSLTVTPRADTQILEIEYINTDKVLAKDLLNSITNEFMTESEELIPNANVKIIESIKMPEKPTSPNKKMNIGIAFLLGLMSSVGLAFLLEFMNNTFKTKEQLQEILGIPVIGAIPDDFS